jgi:predicted MPP superfamily phosphohydrolase
VNPLDKGLIAIFALVQYRITVLLLRHVSLKWQGWKFNVMRVGILAFDAVVAAGCLFSYSSFTTRLGLPGRATLIAGGAVMCYLLAATVALSVHTLLKYVREHWMAEVSSGRRQLLSAAGNVAMASPIVAIGYGALVQRTDFRVREIDVPIPGLAHDLDGLRVLQLSDIHLSAFLTEREFARVVDASRELRPHLAVVTGDLISALGDPLEGCIRQLARLKSDNGILACMGNHERYASAESEAEEMGKRAGIDFLRSACREIRFGSALVNVAGVDYQQMSERKNYLSGAERMVLPDAFNILLSHNPDVVPVAGRQGYNLILAGHTHGGQVTIEILDRGINPARFFTPYVYGLYRAGGAAAYVTRGIGTIGIPARIGAPPEISVLRLRKV